MPNDRQPHPSAHEQTIAGCVIAKKEAVLQRFTQKARRRLPATAGQAEALLRETLHDVVDIIAQALASPAPEQLLHIARR